MVCTRTYTLLRMRACRYACTDTFCVQLCRNSKNHVTELMRLLAVGHKGDKMDQSKRETMVVLIHGLLAQRKRIAFLCKHATLL